MGLSAMTATPKIERRWACVSAADQVLLAAQLSSYFNESGTYFAVLEGPVVDRPFESVPTRDGYFAQILGKRAATHINNCLARLQPEYIILLGLSGTAQSYVRAILPEHMLVTVNTEDELLALPFTAHAPEPSKCKRSQVFSVQRGVAAPRCLLGLRVNSRGDSAFCPTNASRALGFWPHFVRGTIVQNCANVDGNHGIRGINGIEKLATCVFSIARIGSTPPASTTIKSIG
jgi:hypothetical protein